MVKSNILNNVKSRKKINFSFGFLKLFEYFCSIKDIIVEISNALKAIFFCGSTVALGIYAMYVLGRCFDDVTAIYIGIAFFVYGLYLNNKFNKNRY